MDYIFARTKIAGNTTKRIKHANDDFRFEDIGQIKFLYKPVYGGLDDWSCNMEKRQKAAAARIDKKWDGVDLPKLCIIADVIGKDGQGNKVTEHYVYDTHTVKRHNGEAYIYPSTSHDMNGFGDVVGRIRKVGGQWKFIN